MVHVGLSVAANSERWVLDDSEGEKLANATQKVLRHYDLPDIASETKDWIGLIITAGTIYGSRFASAYADKHRAPPPKSEQEEDNNVMLLQPAAGRVQ